MGACVLAVALVLACVAAPLVARTSEPDLPTPLRQSSAVFVERIESHAPVGGSPVTVHFLSRAETSAQAARLTATTFGALDLFTEWFGPYPGDGLIVADAPWRSGLAGAAYAWGVVTSTRWIAPERDRTAERSLVAALARAYWPVSAPQGTNAAFAEGLRLYVAARGVHALLDGRNFATPRSFGGFVPMPRRAVPLSVAPAHPRAWDRRVAEVVTPAAAAWRSAPADDGGDADRAAAALVTLERYVGWPAMQQGLRALHAQAAGAPTPQALRHILEIQRGTSLAWFFESAFRRDVRYDYAIDTLVSASNGAIDGRQTTVVGLRRLADGVFSGADRASGGAFGDAKPLLVRVTFADGARVDTRWDGREPRAELRFEAATPAVLASVDPDGMLQLDADRSNNRRSLVPAGVEPGTRLSAQWWLWLQGLMLTCAALV